MTSRRARFASTSARVRHTGRSSCRAINVLDR